MEKGFLLNVKNTTFLEGSVIYFTLSGRCEVAVITTANFGVLVESFACIPISRDAVVVSYADIITSVVVVALVVDVIVVV